MHLIKNLYVILSKVQFNRTNLLYISNGEANDGLH